MMTLIFALLGAACDRVRGGILGDYHAVDRPAWSKPFATFITIFGYGAIAGLALMWGDIDWLALIAIALGFGLGESTIGYGKPWAAITLDRPMTEYHRWQVGPLRSSTTLSLIAHGAVWGGVAAAITGIGATFAYPWREEYLMLSFGMAAAQPAAAWLSRLMSPIERLTTPAWLPYALVDAKDNAWGRGEMLRGAIFVGLLAGL